MVQPVRLFEQSPAESLQNKGIHSTLSLGNYVLSNLGGGGGGGGALHMHFQNCLANAQYKQKSGNSL